MQDSTGGATHAQRTWVQTVTRRTEGEKLKQYFKGGGGVKEKKKATLPDARRVRVKTKSLVQHGKENRLSKKGRKGFRTTKKELGVAKGGGENTIGLMGNPINLKKVEIGCGTWGEAQVRAHESKGARLWTGKCIKTTVKKKSRDRPADVPSAGMGGGGGSVVPPKAGEKKDIHKKHRNDQGCPAVPIQKGRTASVKRQQIRVP